MKQRLNLTFSIILCLFMLWCKKEFFNHSEEVKAAKWDSSKNPYSVTNMRKTLATLIVGDVQLTNANKLNFIKGKVMFSRGSGLSGITNQITFDQGMELAAKNISATHYYIKFMPRNENDYNVLKSDTNLNCYPFPLDRALTSYSGSYRDPGVPAGTPTYQYAAVSVNKTLPNVPYVKLDDLFLPIEKTNNGMITVNSANQSSYSVSAQRLASESECNGGESGGGDGEPENEEQVPTDEEWYCGPGAPGSVNPYDVGVNFRPHGRITVQDEVLGTVGVEGLRVRALRFFSTYNGFTDANGNYAVDGTFTGPAMYWLDFERYEFSVNDGSNGPMAVAGSQMRAAWNQHFTEGMNRFCSHIFRAAYHYYYKDILGLNRPPENGFWHTQMKLGAYAENNTDSNGSHSPSRRFMGLGEAIHIFNPNRQGRDLYATTIHELAHASHWNISSSDYNNSDTNLAESWAVGVQWQLTRMVYPDYLGRPNGTQNYTNVVMDMIDGPGVVFFDASFQYGLGNPVDQVGGYNIVQIQNALDGARNFNDWRNNILNQNTNPTSNNLNTLFNFWALN